MFFKLWMVMVMQWLVVCLVFVFGSLSQPVHAAGFYTKAGLLGAGLGYFHGITDHVSLRTDFTALSGSRHHLTSGPAAYSARLNAQQWGVYGDWFPFGNGFRLSGGIHVRKLQALVYGHPVDGKITIDHAPVKFEPGDTFTGQMRFPAVAPYVGIGWGYHDMQKTGFGFVFDLGIAFGRPSANLRISESLRRKLDLAIITGRPGAACAANALEGQRKKLLRIASRFSVFPHIYAGISYRF